MATTDNSGTKQEGCGVSGSLVGEESVYFNMNLTGDVVTAEINRCNSIIGANTALLNDGDTTYPNSVYQSVIDKATKDLLYLHSLSHLRIED